MDFREVVNKLKCTGKVLFKFKDFLVFVEAIKNGYALSFLAGGQFGDAITDVTLFNSREGSFRKETNREASWAVFEFLNNEYELVSVNGGQALKLPTGDLLVVKEVDGVLSEVLHKEDEDGFNDLMEAGVPLVESLLCKGYYKVCEEYYEKKTL